MTWRLADRSPAGWGLMIPRAGLLLAGATVAAAVWLLVRFSTLLVRMGGRDGRMRPGRRIV